MPGNYSKLVTVITGQTITAAERNNEFDNVINNMTPDGVDDASLTTAAMQATADPSGANAPTTLRGEIQRLRFQLLKLGAASGNWYDALPFLAAVTPVAGAAAATDLNNRLAQIVGQIKSGFGLTNWYDAITVPLQPQNLLINGGMEISQRGASFSNPTPGTYTLDRWKVDKGASTTVPSMDIAVDTVNREVGAGSSCLDMNITSVGSGATNCAILQYVENYTEYGGKTITCTARIKTSLSGVHIELYDGVTITASANHSGGGAWETVSVTKVLTNSIGSLRCYVGFGSQAPSGTGHIYVDSVMMVVGSQPIPFVPRPYGMELALCQRYYQRIGGEINNQPIACGFADLTTATLQTYTLPVKMRSAPTATVVSPTLFDSSTGAAANIACTAVTVDQITSTSLRIQTTVASGLTVGQGSWFFSASTSAYIECSAEL